MTLVNFDLLKRLCEAPGVAGYEDAVRAIVLGEMRSLVDEMSVDALGNVIGVKRGSGGPRVMLAAHMDEIGFLVKHIDENGFLRLQPVGGFDARVLEAQRVIVHGTDGNQYRGALQPAAKPIHLLDPSEIKQVKVEDLFVDIGFGVDRVREVVELGSMVTMDRTTEVVGDCVMSKSLDDRVCVYIMIEALRQVSGTKAEIVAVATTQEEVGLRGARTAAFRVDPDISVALDGTIAADYPGSPKDMVVTKLGEGPAIKVFDSSHISNRKLVRHFRDVAEENSIAYQLELLPRGGTDAGAMQQIREGTPAVTLSIPMRYVHSVNEMVHQGDLENCVTLLAKYLEAAGSRDYAYDQP
jgi:putative aminopeptidase FrvX